MLHAGAGPAQSGSDGVADPRTGFARVLPDDNLEIFVMPAQVTAQSRADRKHGIVIEWWITGHTSDAIGAKQHPHAQKSFRERNKGVLTSLQNPGLRKTISL